MDGGWSPYASRTARTVAAKCPAPPSSRSSRVTEVMTTCLSPRLTAARATRSGSSASRTSGRPGVMLQKAQLRVQTCPMIRNVAVPWE